jgi:hypothetical protein
MNKQKKIRNVVWLCVAWEITYMFLVVYQIWYWFDTGTVVYVSWGTTAWPLVVKHLIEAGSMLSPLLVSLFWLFSSVSYYDVLDLPLSEWPASYTIRVVMLFAAATVATLATPAGLLCRCFVVLWLMAQSPVWKFRARQGHTVRAQPINESKVISEEVSLLKPVMEDEEVCSVCNKPSLYDICVACEKKHQHEIQRLRAQLRRAKKANVPASLTLAEWLATLKNFNWKCAYCQTGKYQVLEHYVPISRGGGTTAENCVPACFKCNSEKSDEDPGL